MRRFILHRYWPVYTLAVFYIALGATLRVVLWWAYGRDSAVQLAYMPGILLAGAVNDAVQSLYFFAPFALYILLLRDRWYRSPLNRWILTVGSLLTIFALIYLAFVEFYFFQEYDARFNLVAFDYLMYPTEVVGDVWEAYPVVTVGIVTTLLTVVTFWLIHEHLKMGFAHSIRIGKRVIPFLAHALLLSAAILWWRTDTLSFSSNRIANELAQNGHSSFFQAAATSEIDYHKYYVTRDGAANLKVLSDFLAAGGGRFVRLADGRLDREFDPIPQGLGKLNVVVVASESFGAEFSRLYGSTRDLTPNFDMFAQRSLWFRNAYASGTRTVRGLEAISASFPPIPSVSILRRPGNENIATWGKVMQQHGYATSFVYGGYGYFDNMNYYFGNNGFEVLDRKQIAKVRFQNVWGVADEDLFDRALEHFDSVSANGRPFFSIIMTTSNHKPFTFRAGVPGVPEKGGGRAAGVRYADFALGYFLREAEKHAWFKDTIFVVVADHGARVYGAVDIPLKTYEIPLMMYSPRHLAPRRIDTLMGQIDIAPTVLGLLGFGYRAPFFGQDVLAHPEARRVAFFSHNHDVAILEGNRMVVFGLNKSESAFSYDRATDKYSPVPVDAELADLGVAYYQTAFELFREHRYE
jgi:phosphoglycerol transferase MdoB-like AlkP superfamily enzyme